MGQATYTAPPTSMSYPMMATTSDDSSHVIPPTTTEMISPMAALMPQDAAMMQLSMEEYTRAANDMSNYLTWNMMEIPAWLDYTGQYMDQIPPG